MENKENRELFEKNLKELEVVVKELEGGDVTLDQMLELFEKGVKLTKQCTAALDAAEQKINILNEAIGSSITYQGAVSIAEHLLELNMVTMREYEIIKVAVNDRTLGSVEDKNKVRADILKGMVNIILSE